MTQQGLRETNNAIPSVCVVNVLRVNILVAASESLMIYNRGVEISSQFIMTTTYTKDLGILPAFLELQQQQQQFYGR